MDLKIKDVAKLLNVSETTIRRWLTEGKIPAYRLSHQYRFSRTEIEAWVMRQKLSGDAEDTPFATTQVGESTQKASGNLAFSLYRAVNGGGVFHDVPGDTKEEVIAMVAKLLAKPLGLDHDVLKDLLFDREKLMPTALNNGIGIPHARDFLLSSHQDIVAVVFPKKVIDYGALDAKGVHTMFFLFASEDKKHLHLLAKIAHLCSHKGTLDFLHGRPDKKELLSYIKDWESTL